MQAALTDRLIKSLKPDAERPYEVRDTKLQGFLLRVQPSGVMSYICQYRRGKRETLGRVGVLTIGLARKQALDILSAEQGGGYVPAKKQVSDGVETLGDFLEKEYLPWFKAHRKPPYSNLSNLKSFEKYHGKKLEEIDIRLVERWSSKQRVDGKQDSTIKRYLNSLHAVLSKAVEWGVIDKHPLRGMKRIKTDDIGRVRFLSADEDKRLLQVIEDREEKHRAERDSGNQWREARGYELLPDLKAFAYTDHLKPIVLLAKNTGMRKGEILSLRWSAVDLDNAMVTVRGDNAKSGKTRHIPLNSVALDVLTEWKKQSESDYLFPVGSFQKAWQAVVTDSKLLDFTFHDLRHDFASKLVMAGVDLKTVQELLGHADLTMTLRYAHLSTGHKSAAVERIVADV